MKWIIIIIVCFYSQLVSANTLRIVGPDELQLPQTILKLFAQKNNLEVIYPYGSVPKGQLTLKRLENDIKSGSLDVFWSMTDKKLEDNYFAIKIPLFRGLFGYRIPLVKSQDIDMFDAIKSKVDLNDFVAGSGRYWPDTRILKENNINVQTTLKYDNLFRMLEGERFDYYPRGLSEPWDEIKRYKHLNLAVSNNLMFHYKSPIYFFISKNNPSLYNKMKAEMIDMIETGEFIDIFYKDPDVIASINKTDISSRTLITLENSTLSKTENLESDTLWFSPEELK